MSSYLIFILSILFIANVINAFIPHWTRKTENFGVSIPEQLYERIDFKQMRKKYTIGVILFNFVIFSVLIIIGASLTEKTFVISLIISTILFIAFSFIYYLYFHFKMKKIKDDEMWVKHKNEVAIVDTSFHHERLVYSNGWFIISLVIIMFTIIYTFVVYDDIPTEIPIHTSISGKVTYDEKSLGILLMMPFTQLFIVGLMIFINYIIKHSKQMIGVGNPNISKQQNIIFRRRWSLFMIIMATILTLLFTFLQFTFIYPQLIKYEDIVIFTVIGFILFGTVFLSIFTGQGGSRIKIKGKSEVTNIEKDEDKHWKLGQFYFNKEDPSIFVEKRFGIGWTNNWAHPISWILLIILIALPIIIIYLLN